VDPLLVVQTRHIQNIFDARVVPGTRGRIASCGLDGLLLVTDAETGLETGAASTDVRGSLCVCFFLNFFFF
jgi:hypothetical protein